ncbi:MAG TPA: chromosome partitioning protein [Geobacter sp.]|nr:chromosome partitioning protein [Geobacter sp.]
MSNIHEALEQACRDKTCSAASSQLALEAQVEPGVSMPKEMSKLHRQVELLLADGSHKVLQFVGCNQHVGVSTIVREFAATAVNRHGKSVLILDPSYEDPGRRININVTCEYWWLDMSDKGGGPEKAFFRFGNSNLYFAPVSIQASLVPPFNDVDRTLSMWARLRDMFDLILIDSSSDNTEAMDYCCNVDGVILVVEAGNTRRQTAENMKKKIMASGAQLLGVVLNKRRYYIPDFIYKRL